PLHSSPPLHAARLSLYLSHFLPRFAAHLPPHSFPTRRSSDLVHHLAAYHHMRHKCKKRNGDQQVLVDLTEYYGRNRAQMTLISEDRKSTRLNSSHVKISYAVFCLKKKNTSSQSDLRHCTSYPR